MSDRAERAPASVNREAITRRGKNVMRYYAATAVPFNEARPERAERKEIVVDARLPVSPKPIPTNSEYTARVHDCARASSFLICKLTVFATIVRETRRDKLISLARLLGATFIESFSRAYKRHNRGETVFCKNFHFFKDFQEHRVSDITSFS